MSQLDNVLIRAKRENVEHKFEDKVPEDTEYCYWTGVKPRKISPNSKVMFTDGKNVYAEGKILHVDEEEGLQFEPLKRVSYPQPKVAPTRGFTYVNSDQM